MVTMSMTYAELAKRLNIKLDSARKLTRRKRWKRTMGNDGNMRVLVPLDGLREDSPEDNPPDSPTPADHEKDLKIARLEAEVAGLTTLVTTERKRADAAERDRDDWKGLALKPWWKKIVG